MPRFVKNFSFLVITFTTTAYSSQVHWTAASSETEKRKVALLANNLFAFSSYLPILLMVYLCTTFLVFLAKELIDCCCWCVCGKDLVLHSLSFYFIGDIYHTNTAEFLEIFEENAILIVCVFLISFLCTVAQKN